MGQQTAHWDLTISSPQPPLQPLRPAVLRRTPLPRTKLEASVPDGWVTGTLAVDGRTVAVSGWRGTVGHNWGSEHADAWIWLHAEFGTVPGGWLELVLARIRIGRARLPWTAMGALSLDGERIPLGGLGRRPRVDARPGRLTADIPSPGARLALTVTTSDDDAVWVRYADPSGKRPRGQARPAGGRRADPAPPRPRGHPVQQLRGLRVRHQPARRRDHAPAAARGLTHQDECSTD